MKNGKGFVAGLVAGLALTASPALAQSAAGTRAAVTTAVPKPLPLKPGKSAGVHAAQQGRMGLALVGAGAIIAVIAVTASSGGGNSASNQPNAQSVPATTS